MTEAKKKFSRRDAIKLLGAAAGATALANLPSKWSKPVLSGGFVPAHAQTSICTDYALVVEVTGLSASTTISLSSGGAQPATSTSGASGTIGYTLYWNCDPTCDLVVATVSSVGGGSATLQVTVMGVTLPNVVIPSPSQGWWLYLNASTGVYNTGALTGADFTVDGCPNIAD